MNKPTEQPRRRYGAVYCGGSNAEMAETLERWTANYERRGDYLLANVCRRMAERERAAERKAIPSTHAQTQEISDWLRGNVWGYIIREPVPEGDDDQDEGEELDACWGYVGDPDDYVLEQAKAEAEAIATTRTENPAEVGR